MKVLGLIGGTGWVSTAEYYRQLNEEINRREGGRSFAKCVIWSVDYGEVYRFKQEKDTERICQIILEAAARLESAGADALMLCANTLHQFADRVSAETDLPLIHIGDAVGRDILKREISKVGLIGTRQTMEMAFYRRRLKDMCIDTVIPGDEDRAYIQSVIDDELIHNYFSEASRARFTEIIGRLYSEGAQAVVLGCTEIPLLVKQEHTDVPLIDSLSAHVRDAADFALK